MLQFTSSYLKFKLKKWRYFPMHRVSSKSFGKRFSTVIMAAAMTLSTLVFSPAESAQAASNYAPLPDHVAVGYWLGGNGGTNKTLGQVDPRWDVINVSFIETVGNYYTPNLNMDLQAVYSGTPDQQKEAFKQDVKNLQAQGKRVVISCGGQNGVVHIDTSAQRDTFLTGLKAIIDEIGFDGFDVDFEGSSITAMSNDTIGNLVTPQSIHLEYILRDLIATYGEDFIISAAPEYCYVQGGAIGSGNNGAFLALTDAVRDILDYIHPQYYNGFNGDFSWLEATANAGAPFAQVYSEEGYIRLSEMLITGFETKGKGTFAGLRPDQVAFGVPARAGAGNGIQSPAVYASALAKLIAKYPTYRGIMTWSIGWDESGNDAFINAVAPVIEANNGPAQPYQNAQTPTISAQPTDKTVALNGAANLSVAASVLKGNLSYQWYSNTVDANTNGTMINGATNASYSAPTDAVGTTYYYCVVTNTDTNATVNTTAIATTDAAAVTVADQVTPPVTGGDTWQADIAYNAGAIVVYQGNTYRAKWWTQNNIPGAEEWGPWELVD
jgi:chitinase